MESSLFFFCRVDMAFWRVEISDLAADSWSRRSELRSVKWAFDSLRALKVLSVGCIIVGVE